DNLETYIQEHPAISLAEIAATLQVGRSRFEHRRSLVCRTREDALAALTERDARRLRTSYQKENRRAVAFLFPGLGEDYLEVVQELYQAEPLFRQTIHQCCQFLKTRLELNLFDALGVVSESDLPEDEQKQTRRQQLQQTALA